MQIMTHFSVIDCLNKVELRSLSWLSVCSSHSRQIVLRWVWRHWRSMTFSSTRPPWDTTVWGRTGADWTSRCVCVSMKCCQCSCSLSVVTQISDPFCSIFASSGSTLHRICSLFSAALDENRTTTESRNDQLETDFRATAVWNWPSFCLNPLWVTESITQLRSSPEDHYQDSFWPARLRRILKHFTKCLHSQL